MAFTVGKGQYENVFNPATQTYELIKVSGTGPAQIGSSSGGTYAGGSRQTAMQAGQIDKPGEASAKMAKAGIGTPSGQVPNQRPIGIQAMEVSELQAAGKPGVESAKSREISLAQIRKGTTYEEYKAMANLAGSPTSSITQQGINKVQALYPYFDRTNQPLQIAEKATPTAEFNKAYPYFSKTAYYPEQRIIEYQQAYHGAAEKVNTLMGGSYMWPKNERPATYREYTSSNAPLGFRLRSDINNVAANVLDIMNTGVKNVESRIHPSVKSRSEYLQARYEFQYGASKIGEKGNILDTAKWFASSPTVQTIGIAYGAGIVGGGLGRAFPVLERALPILNKVPAVGKYMSPLGLTGAALTAPSVGSIAMNARAKQYGKATAEAALLVGSFPFAAAGYGGGRGINFKPQGALEQIRAIKNVRNYNKFVSENKAASHINAIKTVSEHNIAAFERIPKTRMIDTTMARPKLPTIEYKPQTAEQYNKIYGERSKSLTAISYGFRGRITYSGKNVLQPTSSEGMNLKAYNKFVSERLKPGEIRITGTPSKIGASEIRSTKTVNLMDLLVVGSPALRAIGRSIRYTPRIKASTTGLRATSRQVRNIRADLNKQGFRFGIAMGASEINKQDSNQFIKNIASQQHKNVLGTNQAFRQAREQRQERGQIMGFSQLFGQEQAMTQSQSMSQDQAMKQIQEQIQKQTKRQVLRMDTSLRERFIERPPKTPKTPRMPSSPFTTMMKKKKRKIKSTSRRYITSLGGKTLKQLSAEMRGKR